MCWAVLPKGGWWGQTSQEKLFYLPLCLQAVHTKLSPVAKAKCYLGTAVWKGTIKWYPITNISNFLFLFVKAFHGHLWVKLHIIFSMEDECCYSLETGEIRHGHQISWLNLWIKTEWSSYKPLTFALLHPRLSAPSHQLRCCTVALKQTDHSLTRCPESIQCWKHHQAGVSKFGELKQALSSI